MVWEHNDKMTRGRSMRGYRGSYGEARQFGNPVEYDEYPYFDRSFASNPTSNVKSPPGGEISQSDRKGTFAGMGPKNYVRTDDRINDEVCDTLMWDPDVDASDISVETRDGVVTLSGSVDDRNMKRAAEACADSVPGVKDVRNELRIEPRGELGIGEKRDAPEAVLGGHEAGATPGAPSLEPNAP